MIFNFYTDGACQPNPGAGGWAYIIKEANNPKFLISGTGKAKDTTNNRMEILAVLMGLAMLQAVIEAYPNETHLIKLYADSKYVVNGINLWMEKWVKNNWIKSDKKSVLNKDLWEQIYKFTKTMQIECIHVMGHSGHPENEECDKLAVEAIGKKNENET